MSRNELSRIVTILLIAALCCAMGAPASSADGAPARKAWTHDAMPAAQAKALLDRQELHPQPTGWDKLDARIDALLDESGADDPYGKLWYIYQWMVVNVTYSWSGYSSDDSSVEAYNSFDGYDYLSSMTYAEVLRKSIPDDMANRAYHVLYRQMGVCYDYAIAFAVAARYVGVESYVRTGWFTFEDPALGANHHGWSVLILDGQPYIFDPQRDARNWEQNDRRTGYYFGVDASNWYRYDPDFDAADTKANLERDASLLPVTAWRSRLADVPAGAYYSAPVRWAEENGIAKGVCPFRFQPLDPCTRAQAVTFLWRAAGCPEPAAAELPFTDVKKGAFYVKAVAWAAENGITRGIDAAHFGPDALCTRAQAVAFLWRFMDSPAPKRGETGFTDVEATAFYARAVAWALENKVTNGMTAVTFAPNETCTRGQVVTFLYRAMGEA